LNNLLNELIICAAKSIEFIARGAYLDVFTIVYCLAQWGSNWQLT